MDLNLTKAHTTQQAKELVEQTTIRTLWLSNSHSYSSSENCSMAQPQKPRCPRQQHPALTSPPVEEIERRERRDKAPTFRPNDVAANLSGLRSDAKPNPNPRRIMLWGHGDPTLALPGRRRRGTVVVETKGGDFPLGFFFILTEKRTRDGIQRCAVGYGLPVRREPRFTLSIAGKTSIACQCNWTVGPAAEIRRKKAKPCLD